MGNAISPANVGRGARDRAQSGRRGNVSLEEVVHAPASVGRAAVEEDWHARADPLLRSTGMLIKTLFGERVAVC